MGRRKDAERRKRREQRMAERLQQVQPEQDIDSIQEQKDAEHDTGSYGHDDLYGNIHAKRDATTLAASRNVDIISEPQTNFNENNGKPQSSSSNKSTLDVSKEGMIITKSF